MKKITRMLLLAVCILFCQSVQVMAEEAATFSGSGTIDGEKVTVSVTIDKGGATSGQFEIGYDPALVEIISSDTGSISEAEITSINSEYKGNTAVYAGFANAKEGIRAGELLKVEFKLKGAVPAEGLFFPVSVAEWDGIKQSAANYTITTGPTGNGGNTGDNNNNDGGNTGDNNNNDGGNDSTQVNGGDSGQDANASVSANNNVTVATSAKTGDTAPFAMAGLVMMAGMTMMASAMKKVKTK